MASATTTEPATEPANERVPRIEILDSSRIPVIPFAVSLPHLTSQEFHEPTPKQREVSIVGDNVIVGSVVILNNSVMVWVGWGSVDQQRLSEPSTASTSRCGKGTPVMGQVLISMPRMNYQGAFGTGSNEPSCSQIIGSASSEDLMLATQMGSRLTMRSGMAIFVSCQLSSSEGKGGGGGSWTEGIDSDVLSHRGAALAEKEIWNILQAKKLK